jgi:DNA-binding NarL/FixJ family response regulator
MTPRQAEARRLALSGLTVRQIAAEMGIARQGVEYHLKATNTPPHRAVKYTDEQIAALHQEGLTDADIAAELGISTNTVMLARQRLGLKARLGCVPILAHAEVERVLTLARQGWRQVDIAAECGVSQVTVSKTCIKHGIRRLTRGGSQ